MSENPPPRIRKLLKSMAGPKSELQPENTQAQQIIEMIRNRPSPQVEYENRDQSLTRDAIVDLFIANDTILRRSWPEAYFSSAFLDPHNALVKYIYCLWSQGGFPDQEFEEYFEELIWEIYRPSWIKGDQG